MSDPSSRGPGERFAPRAARPLGAMFDGVASRYDLLNRLLSLGQDRAWRAAMWRAVPRDARTVLDLCTGNGVSLPGLARRGRLVLGMDVSLGMLGAAAAHLPGGGWAPRLVAADAFRLPLRAGAVDAVTVAFGMRNLRPASEAIAEIARVLAPGGTLVVLEGVAPAGGATAGLHRFWLARMVPMLGRLSPDPSAYEYLSRSIFEFGDGASFERDLAAGSFAVAGRERFLFGATRLWVARRTAAAGAAVGREGGDSIPSEPRPALQNDRPEGVRRGILAHPPSFKEREWRAWTRVQAATSATLAVALAWALVEFAKYRFALPLEGWQRGALWVLIGAGVAFFLARAVLLFLRLGRPPYFG
jgi:demethylmenaquinone methyltransferase/2-methoxy-6-polyprenyl-1,4-benzoquinol methylase